MTRLHINVYMTLDSEDLDHWNSDADFTASVRATLHELIADDGEVVIPTVLDADIEEADA